MQDFFDSHKLTNSVLLELHQNFNNVGEFYCRGLLLRRSAIAEVCTPVNHQASVDLVVTLHEHGDTLCSFLIRVLSETMQIVMSLYYTQGHFVVGHSASTS